MSYIWTLCYIAPTYATGDTLILHDIEISHPGIDPVQTVSVQLYEHRRDPSTTSIYHMDVETVVCGDSRCRIDTIQMYWDAIGRYTHIEMPDSVYLEKDGAEHFSPADYAKLDEILSDPDSPLADLYQAELTEKVSGDGVDAMSGATVLIHRDAHVQGAVWTCYSLWHWAHSSAVAEIRSITAGQLSDHELQDLLSHSDLDYQQYAIEQLRCREIYDLQTRQQILQQTEINSTELIANAIAYLSTAPQQVYEEDILSLIERLPSSYHSTILHSISLHQDSLSTSAYQRLLHQIIATRSYPLYQRSLSIIHEHDAWSPALIDMVIEQLDHESFLIARLSYWSLMDKTLTKGQKQLLETFATANQNKL